MSLTHQQALTAAAKLADAFRHEPEFRIHVSLYPRGTNEPYGTTSLHLGHDSKSIKGLVAIEQKIEAAGYRALFEGHYFRITGSRPRTVTVTTQDKGEAVLTTGGT